MTPNQQAQLRQSQQAQQANQPRQAAKPPMQTELEQIVVYQAAKMRDMEQQLIQANTSVLQLQAVLQHSEQMAQQSAQDVQRLQSDIEVLYQYLMHNAVHNKTPLAEVLKMAHDYAQRPKAAEVVMDASPAPASQTPEEVPA